MVIDNFYIGRYKRSSLVGQSLGCHLWKIFIMTEYTSVEELPNMQQPDQFDKCQGPSSNIHF